MRAAAFKRTLTSRHDVKTGFSILALALLALALTAGPAAAEAPSATIGSASSVSYASAHLTGTVDPADVFTFYTFEYSTDGVTWSEFNFEGSAAENTGSQEVSTDLHGLKGGTTYFVRLVANNLSDPEAISAEPNAEFTTLPVAKPTILAVSSGAVTYTTAAVSGKVERPGNPDPAFDASCRFEYVTDAQFTETGFEGASETLCNPEVVTAPEEETPVTATLTGLARGTTYHLRLTASNAGGGNSLDAASTFTTTTTPQAQTTGVAKVKDDSATLAALINPANGPVTYQFQWGTSTAYGHTAPAAPEQISPSNESFDAVTAPITGLTASTVYHYRVIATNTQTNETVEGQDRTFTTSPVAAPVGSCPNESSRQGRAAGLPDCRAYELASVETNGASLGEQPHGAAAADGSGLWFYTIDAPSHAEGSTIFNRIVAKRSSAGWSTYGLAPRLVEPVDGFQSDVVEAVSADLSKAVVQVPQRLAGSNSPNGYALYVREPDGSYTPIEPVGSEYESTYKFYSSAADIYQTPDLSHIYYVPKQRELPSDPLSGENTYEWANGVLRLVGILPGPAQTPAPGGAHMVIGVAHSLPPVSDDGEYVLFFTGTNPLYLREHGQSTVEVSSSQRTVNPDPNPPAEPRASGVAGDGSRVLFTSASELTNDANTGSTEGVANDAGSDLYSYDIATGTLTDLTVDENPADAATGANVQSIVGASHDGSFVYFNAKGALAPGALSGQESFYVEHEGKIDFIAPVGAQPYVTPDGHHIAFGATASLTGYDNVNPVTEQAEVEMFEYTYGGGLECVSCRPSGAPPTSGAGYTGRALSDDGSRAFFQSSDRILPEASSGFSSIYEYESGQVHLISPPDGSSRALVIDASASGDDVFFETHGEIVPGDQGSGDAVYDARVGGEIAAAPPPECMGEGCRGAALAPPSFSSPNSTNAGAGNQVAPVVKPKKKAASSAAKKLAGALKACRRHKPKSRRVSCEKQARKRYQQTRKGAK
jgi:phosphodiesterase/alkaline phosphatase D-like protein